MERLPDESEVRGVVFNLNGNSACGPDEFTGEFFQSCWDIVGEDITRTIRAFFCGQELTKFITHINLILIPKREIIKGFSDLRPISLSSFVNKVISRVIHRRLVKVLPKLISQNETRFI